MTDSVKISVGARSVLASGSVVIRRDEVARFEITADEETVVLNLEFIEPQPDDQAKLDIRFERISPQEATFKGFNFDNPLGAGFMPKQRIATLGSKNLYVAFVIHPVNDIILLSYTYTIEDFK